VKRGDIYTADLYPRSGAEMTTSPCEPRPVIVISHDGFNQVPTWLSIIVVPVSTSKAQAKRGPTAIWLPKGEGGLDQNCCAICHQITTLDRRKLIKHIGILSDEKLREVEEGIKAAIGLPAIWGE
jgi:mRNA interferase MazF